MTQTLSNESLATIDEGKLVQRLLADSHWRGRLLGLHGIPNNARHYQEVLHDDLGKRGDIDILVVAPARPQFATGRKAGQSHHPDISDRKTKQACRNNRVA